MSESEIKPGLKKIIPWWLPAIFLLLTGVIIMMGSFYYKSERNRIFKEQEKSLSAIASLKIKQISQWYSDKLADAIVIKDNEPLVDRIKQFLTDENESGLRKEITTWLEALNTQYDYNSVAVLDTLLRVRLATSNADPLADDSIRSELNNVIMYHKIIMTDLHKIGSSHAIRMDLLVPLLNPLDMEQRTIGLVILSIDPDKILFPLVQSWPTPSKSSETLIFRREGDSVLYLNELRHVKNAALNLKFPLSRVNLLASKAINGFEGVAEGIDYRNVPVIGALSKIPGLPWYMVAKTDKAEILAPFQKYSIITVVVLILLIILNALVFGYWVWIQYLKMYRLKLKDEMSLRKSEELLTRQYYTLKGIVESSGGPIFSLDRNYCYTSFNKSHALTMKLLYGADIELGKSMLDYQTNNDDKIKAKGNIDRALYGENIEEREWSGVDADTKRFFEVIHNPILNDQNEVIGVAINARDLTERKKIEEKLYESEKLFRNLFENMLNGFSYCKMICDEGKPLDFMYLDVNEAFATLTGLKDVMGKKVSEVIPGVQEADPELLQRYNRVSSTGEPEVFESYVESLKMWFAISVYSPQKGYFVAVFDVITARKLAEDKLQESNEYLSNLFNYANAPIIVWDTRLLITRFNLAFEELSGFCRAEVIGKKIDILFSPENTESSLNLIKSAVSGKRWETVEIEIQRKDGESRIVLWNSANIHDKDGKTVLATIAQGNDITERKHAENSLLESEERFRSLYENATMGIYRTTLEGKILMANPALVKMLGFSSFEDLANRNLEEEGYEPDYPRARFLKTLEKEGKIIGLESAWHQRNGNTLYVRESAIVIRDEEGKTLYYDGNVEDITYRKKAEQALHESEKRLREAQEMAHLGFWLWDIKTGDVEWSDEVFKIFCLDPEKFTPQIDSILELSPWPEENKRDKELISRAINSHEPGTYEQRFLRPDKSIGYYYSTFRGNYDNNGDLVSIVGTILDITERKKADEILRESEARFRRLIESAPLPLCYVDKDGKITLRNDRFIKIFGYNETDVPGLREWWLKAYRDPEYRKWVIENWNEAVVRASKNGTDIQSEEYKVNCKDGSVRTIIISGITIGEDLLATFIDITERKLAEEALRESEEKFRSMANSIPQLAWVAHADGFIYWYNQRWYDYTGTKPEQMEGWGWQIVHDPAVLPIVIEKWTASIASGQLFEMSFPLRGADGLFRTFLTRVYPWKDSEGNVIQWFGTNTDVETLKQKEEIITKLNEDLEQKVVQRTELLEAANKELEAFSYSVSHDLRAPLRSVHGFTKILLEDYEASLDEEGKRICGIISSSATQMGELIDDLLSFSRIGRSSLNPSEINMKKLAKVVFNGMTTPAERKRIRLKISNLSSAFGDVTLFGQVWTNLISNALKYTSKEDISEINIGSESDGKMITYFVKDNGVGFDMQYAHKLFGVFQRLHSEADFEGNGVGLAIVQRIILKHGGKVWGEGEVGNGATFYFSLPVQDKRQK
jgi:PAS domain S-box-containing protein